MAKRGLSAALVGVIAIAVVFHAGVALWEWDNVVAGLAWFIWSIVPFAAALLIAAVSGRSILGIVPALVALGFAVWSVYAIRTSTGSTAAIYYLWFPLWNLIGVLVLGIGGYFM